MLGPGMTVTVYLTVPPEVAADAGSDGVLRIRTGVSRVWIGEPGNVVRGTLRMGGASQQAASAFEVRRPWARS